MDITEQTEQIDSARNDDLDKDMHGEDKLQPLNSPTVTSSAPETDKCCNLKSTQDSDGVIYCSKQNVQFKHNELLLRIKLSQHQKKAKHAGKEYEEALERRLIGMLEVIDHIELFGGYIDLYEAYERYRCHQYQVPDVQKFISNLMDEDIGLSVHIIQYTVEKNEKIRLIVPKDCSLDMSKLIQHLNVKSEKAKESEHIRINTALTLQQVIGTMDTEYDKSVAKVLVAANMSDKQCHELGINIDKLKARSDYIQLVIEETKNAKVAAEDIFKLRTREKIENTKKRLEKSRKILKHHVHTMSTKEREELTYKVDVLQNRKNDLEQLLNGSMSDAKQKRAIRRIKLSLLHENRVKRRKSGAGSKLKMLPEDELFLSQCIEEHASVDGRRKEGILYFSRRLKQKDLLSVVNFRLREQGRAAIKSAQTIMNRACPHKRKTVEAKNHRGQWLFCSKKPPKTAIHEKIHTRHQRQARKLAKYHAVTGARGKVSRKQFLVLSKDDKSYLRPGTTGNGI